METSAEFADISLEPSDVSTVTLLQLSAPAGEKHMRDDKALIDNCLYALCADGNTED